MTSGNLSDEPIAYRNDEAIERLGAVADLFVLHDREIVTRCDDSVVRVLAGAPTVMRRSRGYVPRAIALARAVQPSRAGVRSAAEEHVLHRRRRPGVSRAAHRRP